MENTIRTRRIHFSLLFDWKSDLGQSWRHLRDILGRLGKIFEPSWPSTWVHLGPQDGSWAAQEPPERSLQNTQEASWSQEPPKSRPEPSKTPQGGAQTPSKPRFSSQHGGGNAALPRWRSMSFLELSKISILGLLPIVSYTVFLRGFSLWQRGIVSTRQMMVYDQITFC